MRFVLTPTSKLPEALSAFDPLTGSLFSGKFFSAHRAIGENDSAVDSAGIEGWEAYVEEQGIQEPGKRINVYSFHYRTLC